MGKDKRTERKPKTITDLYGPEFLAWLKEGGRGHPPEIMRKGGAHRDRSKYRRKQKHGNKELREE